MKSVSLSFTLLRIALLMFLLTTFSWTSPGYQTKGNTDYILKPYATVALAESFQPCSSDTDCSINRKEYCNKQYTELIVPPCSKGFCQCEKGYFYGRQALANESCRNECATYAFGDVCGAYPTRLFPEGAACIDNMVTCKANTYCPMPVKVRGKKYGEECSKASDCNHFSIACLPDNRRAQKFVCKCHSDDYVYDETTGKCRRYKLGDPCNRSCGSNTLLYKNGLICNMTGSADRGVCLCDNPKFSRITEITVPAVRIGAPDSEAYLEVFDTIQICATKDAVVDVKPGSPCDLRHMTAICEKGAFCLPCLNGCPYPICRALRKSPDFDNRKLKSIATLDENLLCRSSYGSLISVANIMCYDLEIVILLMMLLNIHAFIF